VVHGEPADPNGGDGGIPRPTLAFIRGEGR
jgi:hypothetical protein